MKKVYAVDSSDIRPDVRRMYSPRGAPHEWADWRRHLSHRFPDAEQLGAMIPLSGEVRRMIKEDAGTMPLAITPYYLSVLCGLGAGHPLWKTVLPSPDELHITPYEYTDPLGEDRHEPLPGLIHTYPDKALLLVTQSCATYCRYCTRSRRTGRDVGRTVGPNDIQAALAYIRGHTEIRDVLLSGGDPLMLEDRELDGLLAALYAIPHVELVRLGTRMPIVLPQRVTPELVSVLSGYRPCWITLHFTHPDEITPEVETACNRLADAGIPLGNQTVLLAGVNNELETMKTLMLKLLRLRVRPYYLHQCDAVAGTAHFRTPVREGLEIIRGLHGHTTGYAVPTFMIDAPGGGGKVPVMPNYIRGHEGKQWIIENYQGKVYTYHE